MPGTQRTYTYTLKATSPADHELLAAKARKVLGYACDGDSRITCHGVSGDAVGVVQISLTVRARSRWHTKEIAWDIINMVTWGLDQPAELDLVVERPPVHTHRGYRFGRTKQWREPSSL